MICTKCTKQFIITQEDHEFYAKIGIPAPTLCPSCRRQRRLAFRNERALYSRPCNLCKKTTVSFYSPSYSGPVYCQPCWWSDGWDSSLFAREYDPSRPFFEQLNELFCAVPCIAMFNTNSENSEFTAHSSRNKNCYMLISALTNENCFYGFQMTECQDAGDSYNTNKSTLGYELVDCGFMYRGGYCQKSLRCVDSWFLYDCHGCSDCFFSVNLRNKQYVFHNEQLSQKEYSKRVAEIAFCKQSTIERLKEDFATYIQKKAIHKYSDQLQCEEAVGNYLFNCKKAMQCFDARNLENCKYIVVSPGPTKDSYDVNYCVFGAELFCEVLSNVDSAMNQQFCQYSWASSNIQYCSYVMNSDSCFGSAGMKKAKFCILNKQYTEDEYTRLRLRIIEDMKAREEYGQFFLPELSAFGYNETIANDEWPLTREAALSQGFNWSDQTSGRYDPPTREWSTTPDDIAKIEESICKEVLACTECKKNFKILKSELAFYKKMNVPLSRRCFDCRHLARMRMRNPRKLYHRQCVCDRVGHEHGERCLVEFETTYAPNRSETVFCETCYQKEGV
ncbi:MAG: zinc-ribbon domain containing protein [Candidatus Uhrbacteria bacterium]|nr:zinc-ribbon domain containing protein [Candidatus Uhrbacteria bacterium]